MSTGIIIQVRAGSARMPGKMILPFYEGKSIIELIIDRFISEIDNNLPLIIATTENPIDDKIENIVSQKKTNLFRGSESDVLLRFIRAAEKYDVDTIIRICADNPLIDIKGTMALTSMPAISEWDYIGYKIKGERPTILTHSGFWGEVVTLSALKKVHEQTTNLIYREHVTNFIHQQPEKFRVKLVNAPGFLFSRDDIRLTVDTKEDFAMMQEIYGKLVEDHIPMEPEQIIRWIDKHPAYLKLMNKQIELNKKV